MNKLHDRINYRGYVEQSLFLERTSGKFPPASRLFSGMSKTFFQHAAQPAKHRAMPWYPFNSKNGSWWTRGLFLRASIRSLRRIWFELMDKADYSCSMNHLFDAGEFSSAFDGDIYKAAYEEFREMISSYRLSFDGFREYVNEFGMKDRMDAGGWGNIAMSIAMFESEKEKAL